MNPEIQDLIESKALFVVNHSGGKDSQAMLIKLAQTLPDQIPREQMIVVHASLGDVEWPGALELAEKQALQLGIPFLVAKAKKTFFEMVEHRFATNPNVPSWPSPSFRQCTSDLKRGPIQKVVRAYAKEHGYKQIVNCLGLRAEESSNRARKPVFKLNKSISNSVNTWYEWLPVHDLTKKQVFGMIKNAGQEPHYAYALGNERLSCVFCIMGSKNDLENGAEYHPNLLKEYQALERKTGYTMHASRIPIVQLTT